MATISETYIENRERIQPNDTNNYDAAHGGNVVKWMDEVGVMSAMRHAGENCVTAHIDRLDFTRPVPRGDNCVIEAWAYEAGRTSIKVRIIAYREDPQTGKREETTDSHFVFVAIDENYEPTTVPELTVETDRCRELREAALQSQEG